MLRCLVFTKEVPHQKYLSHFEQVNGSSPMCLLSCTIRFSVWVSSCSFRLYRAVKFESHILQVNGFSFVCILSCFVTVESCQAVYKGRVCTKILMALLAADSVVALVTDKGAEFHNCTEGYWKLFSLSLLLKPDFNLILFELLVCCADCTTSNKSFKQ